MGLVLRCNVAPAILGNEARIKTSGALSLVNLSFQGLRLSNAAINGGVVDSKILQWSLLFLQRDTGPSRRILGGGPYAALFLKN